MYTHAHMISRAGISLIIFVFFSVFAKAEDFLLAGEKIAGAPSIKFILSENYLIAYTLAKSSASGRYSEDVVAFQNLAWEKDQSTYKKLMHSELSPEQTVTPEFVREFGDFFELLKATPEFAVIRQQTQDYMRTSVSEWNMNLEKSLSYMVRYSGFSFAHKVNAYITHPALGNGRMQNRNLKILSFGAWPTFSNYFTVYIWHEIIHFHMQLDSASHAVNQLLTDNDLRVELNGGPLFPLEGHSELMELMKQFMPLWKEYKNAPSNLNEFVRHLPN